MKYKTVKRRKKVIDYRVQVVVMKRKIFVSTRVFVVLVSIMHAQKLQNTKVIMISILVIMFVLVVMLNQLSYPGKFMHVLVWQKIYQKQSHA